MGKITATFVLAEEGKAEFPDLIEYNGQRVTLLGENPPTTTEGARIEFADGNRVEAFADELTEWRLEA